MDSSLIERVRDLSRRAVIELRDQRDTCDTAAVIEMVIAKLTTPELEKLAGRTVAGYAAAALCDLEETL